MCWFGYITDRHVAKEDMKVFKMLYREPDSWIKKHKDCEVTYHSPFHSYEYILEEEREVKGLSPFPSVDLYDWGEYEKPRKIKIEEGLHCYSLEKCKRSWHNLYVRVDNELRGVIQRYPREDQGRIIKAVLCIIPKGTVYWENQYGEIVTEKLIPIEEL